MEEGQIKIVTRTQVYLDDPEFFCNKSWTLSFNFNTKSWVSFHSYLPNWYIGENNFFYSGSNNCCSDIDADFVVLTGELNRTITTTTTTTFLPVTTTSTTTFTIDCDLIGEAFEVQCNLEGTGVITVPPTPTPTICTRPPFLVSYTLYRGYTITGESFVDTSVSYDILCESFPIILSPVEKTLTSFTCMSESTDVLEVGQTLYDTDYLTDCSLVSDGWYFSIEGLLQGLTYHVVNGVIVEISYCGCNTTTTTTTSIIVPECCGTLILSNDEIFLLNPLNGYVTYLLDVPSLTSADGLAITNDNLWIVNNTQFLEWDVTLNPFSAVYNRFIDFPLGYVPGSFTVLNTNTLICVDKANYPTSIDVVEMDITGAIGVSSIKFTLPSINITSNLLYTFDNKLVFANVDLVSGDTYLSQYDYITDTIEISINIGALGSITITSIFECDCAIFFINSDNIVYSIRKESPYDIIEIGSVAIPVASIAQPNSCIPNYFEPTTTTTTTIP